MKILLIILIPLLTALAIFFGFRFATASQASVAALQITSTPTAEVFLDNVSIGKTPLSNDKLKPGEHTLKLVPEGSSGLFNYEEKIVLREGILTVVDRIFKSTETESEVSILSLEHISVKNATELTIVSSPEGAEVKLDEQPQGITPLLLKDITPSDHQITIGKKGYNSKTLRIKPTEGYRLTISVKLAIIKSSESQEQATSENTTATPSPADISKTDKQQAQVEIIDTPTGFLRVRESPTTASREIAKVDPGESFLLLEEEESWFKIQVSETQEGWISSQYAKKK